MNQAVKVEVWKERDRLYICAVDAEGAPVAEWWDEEAWQMFEDGFFKSGRELEASVLAYVESMMLGGPVVGMLATYQIGSDRYAGKMTSVERKGKLVTFRSTRGGLNETFTLRGDGAYRLKGLNCGRLYLGKAEDYRDPGF